MPTYSMNGLICEILDTLTDALVLHYGHRIVYSRSD